MCEEFPSMALTENVFNGFNSMGPLDRSWDPSKSTNQKTHISEKILNTENEPKICCKTTGHVCGTQGISRRITKVFWRKLNLKLGLFCF